MILMKYMPFLIGSGTGSIVASNWVVKYFNSKGHNHRKTIPPNSTQKVKYGQVKLFVLLALIVGAFVGMLITNLYVQVLNAIEFEWTKFIFRGTVFGACVPSLMQAWAILLDILNFMRSGSKSTGQGLVDRMIDTMYISITQYQLMNISLVIIFGMAGSVAGAMIGSVHIVMNHQELEK